MPLATIQPTFADDPTDPDALWVGLGPLSVRVSKAEIGEVVDGRRRTTEAVVAQLGNLLVSAFSTAQAVESATATQIAAAIGQGPFYW